MTAVRRHVRFEGETSCLPDASQVFRAGGAAERG
jgi:hypothetical protein